MIDLTTEQVLAVETFVTKTLAGFALDVVGAIAILIAGYTLSKWAANSTTRFVERTGRIDATLQPLAIGVVRYSILSLTVMAVLARFGVQTASVIAVLGAAGLAIGPALQGTLSNVAAGVMLLVLRPFKVNDVIMVAGQTGAILQIGLFTTNMNTNDNVFVSLPNSAVWNSPILNYTRNPTRRIDLTIGISYGDDIDKAIAVALEALVGVEGVVQAPAPTVAVRLLGESSVDLAIRGFVPHAQFWTASFAIQRAIKLRFDEEGITIPFPQRTVHYAPAPTAPNPAENPEEVHL